MANIKELYPGWVTLDDSFDMDRETLVKYQLGHLNQYRSQMGLDGGLTFDIKKAEGCYMWDEEGNKRLDFIGCVGVYVLGHNNPDVINGVRKYLDTKPMTMDPMSLKAQTAAFAHNMSLVFPELTRTVICGGGGAEANETIIKMCKIAAGRTKKGKKRIVSTLNSFHGKTNETVFTGGKDVWQRWLTPPADHTYVPYGDIDAVEAEFKKGDVIMWIAEPIQGEGGIVVPPDDYFPKVRELCDKYDVYMIIDEVQAGSCRTGYLMAHKYYEGLVPDGFSFAKAISDGVLPVSGVQAKEELYLAAYGSYESAMNHTATFQDNNMSATVALCALQYMLENDVPALVRNNSKYIWDGLNKLQAKYPHILEEVRGRGFMIGLKFNKDAEGVGYANAIGRELAVNHLIHTMTSINDDTILRCYPNIYTTEADFDWFLDGLEKSFLAVEG